MTEMIGKITYIKSLIFLLIIFIIFESVIVIVGDLSREPWGDEYHFVQTVNQFGTDCSLETLTHYKEMSGPLPFIIYSLWGRVFGFDLFILRLLSILIAMASYVIFHRFLFLIIKSGTIALLGTMFLMIHPYMVGFSIFVFTDGITILFLLLALYGNYRRNTVIYGLAMAAALLSRQFAIFFLIASIIYWILKGVTEKKKMLTTSLLSLIPYLYLIMLWGGFSPDNPWRIMYLANGFTYHINYLVLYICLIFVYLIPFVLWNWKRIYNDKTILLISVVLSFLYWFFPVGPSQYDIANNTYTVGLFNKLLIWINPASWFDQAVFYVCFLLGLPVLITFLNSLWKNIKHKKMEIDSLLDMSVVSFLVIMPFSYLGWEKYIIPLVPFLVIRLLLLNRSGG